MTLLLNAKRQADVERAAAILQAGGTVAVPTETVYGLAANAADPAAIHKVFQAKNRPTNHPLIVHIGTIEQLSDWACEIPELAYQLAQQCWPGPLTLLLKRHPRVSTLVTGGQDSVAIRMPAHPVLRQLLAEHRLAVVAPSANRHQQLSPTRASDVMAQLNGRIDAVLDGGQCPVGIESTILDLRMVEQGQAPQILRPGPLSARYLSQLLKREVQTLAQHNVAVAGNQSRHYQPKTPLYWWHPGQALEPRQHLLSWQPLAQVAAEQQTCLGSQAQAYAQALYATLADLDQAEFDCIWVQPLPLEQAIGSDQQQIWQAVQNRLVRAVQATD
ncbi:L-threonylcarbamoyladenylate synthase [Pseudidiomarina taiwanensis]|uniref:Threonylcarbamoyl-AMP synthase n=1 Tax=Pseudidiomarina taiwanensis TaxID=337250 RepID=A0A432ZFI9_9GAMM|nr:L-threonylcarbamoyladenylate synthase [Pseudidiomarina taiwanensis]RUO76745.1 threonylcarbamoyl-AMP synthase [Pseudidiomarina taiwanensis]